MFDVYSNIEVFNLLLMPKFKMFDNHKTDLATWCGECIKFIFKY